jgi:hypothetical protein
MQLKTCTHGVKFNQKTDAYYSGRRIGNVKSIKYRFIHVCTRKKSKYSLHVLIILFFFILVLTHPNCDMRLDTAITFIETR